jgi:hypothetical protein
MDIHWIFTSLLKGTIDMPFMDLRKDSRGIMFYNWYSRPAMNGYFTSESPYRNWIMVF